MCDRWEVMREYFRSRQGSGVNFAYINAKSESVRGFGIVYLVCDAHVVLKTRTARGYASFDYHRMINLMTQFGIVINNPLQAGYSQEDSRVEI